MNLQNPNSPIWPIISQVALIAATTVSCVFLYKNGLVPKDAALMGANAVVLYLVYLLKQKMTTQTFPSRNKERAVDTRTLDHHGVPHSVLTGTDKRYLPVYALFRARLTQEWLRHLNVSYWTRAQGDFDPVAGRWKKLAKNTIKAKQELEAEGQHTNYTAPGQLPPGINAVLDAQQQYNAAFNEILNNDKSSSTMATKRARARKAALAEQGERTYAKLINIRTGRLVAATAPGEVVNNRYYPTKDQDVKFQRTSIRISLRKVEYAGEVDAQREIIPRNTDVWYIEAWNTIMPEVAMFYQMYNRERPYLKLRDKNNRRKKKKTDGLEDAPFQEILWLRLELE